MKKMIHQFALEYASKCLLHTNTNGVTTRTSSPLSDTSDAPLDLTMSRTQEEKAGESDPGGEGIEYAVNTLLINSSFELSKFYPSTVTQSLTSLNKFFMWQMACSTSPTGTLPAQQFHQHPHLITKPQGKSLFLFLDFLCLYIFLVFSLATKCTMTLLSLLVVRRGGSS